ncbi:MAG: CheR family methyltransferase [Glaciecola sp.]
MIHILLSHNIKKLLIDDTIQESDIGLLKKELSSESTDIKYEITFVHIDFIPNWLVKLLVKMKNNITIETTQRALWVYLSKLGIKNQLKYNAKPYEYRDRPPLKAIAIGGSAGSIEKILALISQLPYADISIFIVVHLSPNKKSHLASIIQNITQYKVAEALHNTPVNKNCIYIAPPNYHFTVIDNYMYLDKSVEVNYARPSLNVTFKSLAYEYQDALIVVLLCGYGSDGTSSMEDLKQNNCEIIIQDPQECEAKEMLLNAISTHHYTKILTTVEMTKYLQSHLSTPVTVDAEVDIFLDNIKCIYGYDFINYEKAYLKRRIELTMKQNSISSFEVFKKTVFDDEQLFSSLLSAFSINVTTFFRNPEVFKTVREQILPYLESYPSIRVWCAGCSSGDEAYSVAIMLDELGLLHKSLVYATDFTSRVLNEAQNGLFPRYDFTHFESNYITSGGHKELQEWFEFEDEFIEIKEHIKKKVLFFQHNLVTDTSINEFHLIFCRNVLIYFNRNLQTIVFNTIDDSLSRGGFLVLGESERLPEVYNYKILDNKIYQKDY